MQTHSKHANEHGNSGSIARVEHMQKVPSKKARPRSFVSLQHEDGGRGELEDDLRSKQGAERPREGKGGQGAAAHRTLW